MFGQQFLSVMAYLAVKCLALYSSQMNTRSNIQQQHSPERTNFENILDKKVTC